MCSAAAAPRVGPMRLTRLLLLTSTLSLLLAAAAQAAPVGLLKQYKIPTANSRPGAITNGSDGNRWFTQGSEFLPSGQLARITPTGTVTEFPGVCDFCITTDIAQGPGNIVYWTSNEPFIGRITTAGTLLSQIPMPNSSANSSAFAVDSARGLIWLADFNNDVIWRYDIAAGTFTSPISTPDPTDVAVAADGDVYFGENFHPGNIGHYDAQTNTTTRTAIPSGGVANQLTIASDGDVWFTERFSSAVGRLDPATNTVSEIPLPGTGPMGIAPAAGGAVWFTQETKGNVARIAD